MYFGIFQGERESDIINSSTPNVINFHSQT